MFRVGDYKMIWGSRTEKNRWFPAHEEPRNQQSCNEVLRSRSKVNRSRSILVPRDTLTMDVWKLDFNEDIEYEEDYDKLEKLQEVDLETDGLDQLTELAEDVLSKLRVRVGKKVNRKDGGGGDRRGGVRKGGGNNKHKHKKKGNFKKSFLIPNENNVKIRTWGDIMLFNVAEDPEERHDLSKTETDIVEGLKARAIEHFYQLQPRHVPPDNPLGDPGNWGGYWGPGWCELYNVKHINRTNG